MEKKIHQGKNITRFRQMLGIKQEALAATMGDDWTQLKISRLEAKEEIEPGTLHEVAKALKIPAEAIQNFDEEAAIAYINTFNDNSANHGTIGNNYDCQLTFNPIDKMVELYERVIQQQKEMIEKLERLLDKK